MRLFEPGSVSTPARFLIDALLVVAGIAVALEALVVVVLLVNPLHPIRHYFQVTTIASVPGGVCPAEDLVRVEPGSSTVTADGWAYLTYRPTSRAFVFATAIASLANWACVLALLLNLRRAFTNISAGTPFPRGNVRCIRWAGWAILGLAAIDLLITAVFFTYMRATTTIAGQPPVIPVAILVEDLPLGTLLAGLAVIVLAEIFKAGADMQDDQALTV